MSRERDPPPFSFFFSKNRCLLFERNKKKKEYTYHMKKWRSSLVYFSQSWLFSFFPFFFFLAMTLCPEWFWTMTNCRERIVVSKILFSFAFCQSCVTDSCIRVPQTVLRRIKIFILFVLLSPLYLDT